MHRAQASNTYLRVFLLSSPSFSEIPVGARGSRSQDPASQALHLPRWPRVCLPCSSGDWIPEPWGPTSCSSAANSPLHPPTTGMEGPSLNNPQQLRGPSRKLPAGGCPSPSKSQHSALPNFELKCVPLSSRKPWLLRVWLKAGAGAQRAGRKAWAPREQEPAPSSAPPAPISQVAVSKA